MWKPFTVFGSPNANADVMHHLGLTCNLFALSFVTRMRRSRVTFLGFMYEGNVCMRVPLAVIAVAHTEGRILTNMVSLGRS